MLLLVGATLRDLRLAIAGTIALSDELAEALDALHAARVPKRWAKIRWASGWGRELCGCRWLGGDRAAPCTPDHHLPHCRLARRPACAQRCMAAPASAPLTRAPARHHPHARSWEASGSGSWFAGLLARHEQLHRWLNSGRPKSYWLTGFFNPQGFLTAGRWGWWVGAGLQ